MIVAWIYVTVYTFAFFGALSGTIPKELTKGIDTPLLLAVGIICICNRLDKIIAEYEKRNGGRDR